MGVLKPGAEFISDETGHACDLQFRQRHRPRASHTATRSDVQQFDAPCSPMRSVAARARIDHTHVVDVALRR